MDTIQLNTIYNENCLETMKRMPDNFVDLVLTDPPYGIWGKERIGRVGNRNNLGGKKIIWDEKTLSEDMVQEIVRISKHRIIWGANYINCFERGGAIVWDKLQPMPDSSQCEIASISKYQKVFKYEQRWTNFVNTKETKHPTEKPVELMKWCLNIFPDANIIYDPFIGSGTTARACKDLGRNYIGSEISKEYCDIAEKRLGQEVLL